MNENELKKSARNFRPAFLVERYITYRTMLSALRLFGNLSLIFLILFILAGFTGSISSLSLSLGSFFYSLPVFESKFRGLFFVSLSLWLAVFSIRAFYTSYRFKGIRTILKEPGIGESEGLTFTSANSLFSLLKDSFLRRFFSSEVGRIILFRLGIPPNQLGTLFLASTSEDSRVSSFSVPVSESERVFLETVAGAIFDYYGELRDFLASRSITRADFVGSAKWVEEEFSREENTFRWWGRDALGRIPGIGKDWAYGGAYALRRYAREISELAHYPSEEAGTSGVTAIKSLEAILARSREANALLLAEEGTPSLSVLALLAEKIKSGVILPPLEHKLIFVFDGNAFIDSTKEKIAFENGLGRLLSEAIRAGNIILVIPDLPSFFESARSIGSDAISIMEPFMSSPNIQIVGIASPSVFHATLEHNDKFMKSFEIVKLGAESAVEIVGSLFDTVARVENESGMYFTYPALRVVAESAERYFSEGALSDKTADLLAEIPPRMKETGRKIITTEDVLRVVKEKTGVPLGALGDEERKTLLKLEEVLRVRIVGQKEAVSAIANALRRARSGVGNPNRPMGSFLFLGPTGVGKTETTKALASAFFGDENRILRLDMSEYRTDDALERLIGSFERGKAGVFASMVRDKPYGVLLLDEFEKTNKEVLDLFLQILDEGFFTDAGGKKVNTRNLIIIATSNAGSDLIWKLIQEKNTLSEHKSEIIDELVSGGIFKPELLNRFDGVILFHPLSESELRKVAELMLAKLNKRLLGKGISIIVNDAILDYLVSVGNDPKFGARAMNRAIQEKIEQIVALRIIRGEALPGSTIELRSEDIS